MGLTALLLLLVLVFGAMFVPRASPHQGNGSFGASLPPPLAGEQDEVVESVPVPAWDDSDHHW